MSAAEAADFCQALTPDVIERQMVHVMDLSCIKLSIGSLWPNVREGVGMRLSAILQRHLQPGDYSAALDNMRYLLAASRADSEQSAGVALRIAHEFTLEILGACDLDQLRIERVHAVDAQGIQSRPLRAEDIVLLAEKIRLVKTGLAQKRQAASAAEEVRIVHLGRRTDLSVTHRFEPVWDARHEAITTYLCLPARISEGADATDIPLADLDMKERLSIELSCISSGIGYLSRFIEAGDRFVLGIPVNFDTLSSPFGRAEFVKLCRGIPSAYRPYINFMLCEVPPGIAQSRLSDLAMLLRPFGRTIATVAAGARNFSAYQGHGLYAIALDVSQADPKAPGTTSDIVHLATAARNARMMSMVFGIGDVALVNQACAAEIQLLQGQSVAGPQPSPRRMSHLPRAAVLPASTEAAEEWF